jgi:hypothetical protein
MYLILGQVFFRPALQVIPSLKLFVLHLGVSSLKLFVPHLGMPSLSFLGNSFSAIDMTILLSF